MPLANEMTDCRTYSQRQALLTWSWSFVLVAVGLLIPAPANAAGVSTLGDLVCNVKNNGLSIYPRMVNIAAYIAGAFMAVKSILLYRKHAENPAQPQMAAGTAHLFASGGLLAFPSFIGVVQRSFFPAAAGKDNFACEAGAVGKGAQGLDVMMQNFVQNLHAPVFMLLAIISVAVGVTMLFQALMRASKIGTDPRAGSPKDIVTHLVFGAILVSMGTVLPSTMASFFGDGSISTLSSSSIIQWSNVIESGNTEAANKTVRAVLAFVQIVGGISFVRGWLLLKKAVEGGQATIPQSLTHILGGAAAINIDKMLKILNDTFGVNVIA